MYDIARAKAFGGDVALPHPVAYRPDLKLLVQWSVAGEPVKAAMLGGEAGVAAGLRRPCIASTPQGWI